MFEKEIWIAHRKSAKTNKNGIEIEKFDTPIKYRFNYQPISGNTKLNEYGDNINSYYRMFVDRNVYQGKIKTGDRAYLSNEDYAETKLEDLAMNDDENCKKANYRVMVVLPQNLKIRIDLMRIK